jgi:hypothetical protein
MSAHRLRISLSVGVFRFLKIEYQPQRLSPAGKAGNVKAEKQSTEGLVVRKRREINSHVAFLFLSRARGKG